MAGGRKPQEGSLSSEIRNIFLANKKLIWERSNEVVKERWSKQHEGQALPDNFDGVLGNVKSGLRKKYEKKGKAIAAAAEAAEAIGDTAAVVRSNLSDQKLSRLGDDIDDCYFAARGMNRKGMDVVTSLLKRARNRVVVMAGERE
jgi:hypothetical protein